jgi:hypothetical protein
MTTAKLVDFLASSMTDSNGDPLSGYQVRSYASDGSTAKAVWADRAKTLPDTGGKTEFNLSTSGTISVYGDGIYVFKLWTSTADPDVDNPYLTIGPTDVTNGKDVTIIESIADLRLFAATPEDNDTVDLLGYYASGDGGGGLFYWDISSTETDNGGTIIKVTTVATGRWKMVFSGPVSVKWFGAKGDSPTTDDTTSIQAAFDSGYPVVIPDSDYRCDASLVVPTGQTVVNEGKLIRTTDSAAVTPVLYLKGSYTTFNGGTIETENNHASGIVVLGHESIASTYNALYWNFRNVDLFGKQVAGNIGISIVSAQPYVGASAANYFGNISNISVKGSDIGVKLTEIANGHNFSGVSFWNMITSGYQLVGSYGNSIFGGFLHTSTNGVIGVQLLNETAAYAHDSDANQLFGFHVEPGGAASKSLYIDDACEGNFVYLNNNVAGGHTILNDNNFFFSPNADNQFSEARTVKFGTIYTNTRFETDETKEYRSSGTGLDENTSYDMFSVTLSDKRSAIVELSLTYYNNTLDKKEDIHQVWSLSRSGAVTTVNSLSGGSAGAGLTAHAFTTAVPAVFSITTFNNGTSTTGNYSYSVTVRGTDAPPTVTVII